MNTALPWPTVRTFRLTIAFAVFVGVLGRASAAFSLDPPAGMAVFRITQAAIKFQKQRAGADTFAIAGELALLPYRDADPVNEEVAVTVGPFSQVLAPASFTPRTTATQTTWKFSGHTGGIASMTINRRGARWSFLVRGVGLQLGNIASPVRMVLRIGEEIGALTLPFDVADRRQSTSLMLTRSRRFSYEIDAALTPQPASLPDRGGGTKPLAAVQDELGSISVFVANEVLISPRGPTELADFLARYGGTVIDSDAVPAPPAELNITLDPAYTQPTFYVVRLDPPSFSPTHFASLAKHFKFSGVNRVSSDTGARLLAVALAETHAGLSVELNFVDQPTSYGPMIFQTEERPTGGFLGWDNAFDTPQFSAAGSKASVTQAWQFVSIHGISRRVKVAVIDGGFWLDALGHPNVSSSGTDLPSSVAQYDFADDDYIADGPNPVTCTGGSSCPWHGNGSVGVATGIINNRAGAAGTGGSVADPMLFKSELTAAQESWAMRTAVAWGADVISMSFSSHCDKWCMWSRSVCLVDKTDTCTYFDHFMEARNAGLVLVAAAGNDNENIFENHVWPCTMGIPICVGALDDGANTRIYYSNFGEGILAPTNIPVMANVDTAPALKIHGGTSASTPFVAGITAMMKAIDPSLNLGSVWSILASTAWTDSTDSTVPRYVNAYRAVMRAAGDRLDADALESNDTPMTAASLPAGITDNLTFHTSSDVDYYRFSVSDYSTLDLDLTFIRDLSPLTFLNVIPESGPPASDVTDASRFDGRLFHAGLLAPASYLIKLRSASPNLYKVNLSSTVVGLSPDMFEPDDTVTTPASPAKGTYEVNLHVASDVDYYAFFPIKTPAITGFNFSLESSDFPLETLRLYDSTGTEIDSDATKLNIPFGALSIVRVAGAQKGRYIFSAYDLVDKSLFPEFVIPVERFVRIKPGDGPWPGWLVIDREFFVFAQDGNRTAATLSGFGVHATLRDKTGAILAEGQATQGGQNPGETVSLAAATANEDYVLEVGRTADDANTGGNPTSLPALRYTVSVD
jgi:hypothetical protein